MIVDPGNAICLDALTDRDGPLRRRPLLRAVQYSQHLHLFLVNFVNCREWKGSKNELPGALNASLTASVRKGIKRVDTSHYVQCNASGRLRPIVGNIVGDSLKIVGRVGRPPDAHQAR